MAENNLSLYGGWCMIVASLCGLLFGYTIAISGGVTVMEVDFLMKFFPKVHEGIAEGSESEPNYCKYNDPLLQFFTSSLYLSAFMSSVCAPLIVNNIGRKPTIVFAAALFIVGSAISAAAVNLIMLISGRIISGFAVGFANVVAPLYLSELAPPVEHRGIVANLFQQFIATGIFFATLVNELTSESRHPFGWRISLGSTGIPALVLLLGAIHITETPASLIQRGKEPAAASQALKKIRGVEDVDAEFNQIKNPTRKKTKFSTLIVGVVLQIFQAWTGINAIMSYAPVLFKTLDDSAFASALFIGEMYVCSTLLSLCVALSVADKVSRRNLLTAAGVVMCICQVALQCIILGGLKTTRGDATLGFMCVFVMAFACSWGPLGWEITIESFPLEARTTGFAFAVSSNMLSTFLITQLFLSAMCHIHAIVFSFFALGVSLVGYFVCHVPESKNDALTSDPQRV